MEGFLLKRRAKGRLFRSENWSSHWYVLEGATLAEYKGFDTATSKPSSSRRDTGTKVSSRAEPAAVVDLRRVTE